MSNIALVLKTAEGNTIARYDLNTARVAQIDAVNGAYYQFTDAATGTGPVRIDTARSGDDLLISFDNSNGTDLIIKDYFARGEGALVGMQNNGELYRYPVIVTPEHVLAEHIETAPAYASGAEGAVAAGSSGGPSTLGVLGTIGAVGLVAGGIAIAAHNHDKHHKNDHHDNPPNPQPNPNPNPNPQPAPNKAGTVTINGNAKVGETLTATVKDDDGFDSAKVKYQWQRDGVDIKDATGSSYKLGAADVGHKITVKATYTDNAQHSETPISAATDTVTDSATPPPNPQPQPGNHEGKVTITGEAKVGETLTATVKDDDGFDSAKVKYQWQRDGVDIKDVTGSSYKLGAADVGHKITVKATYTDNAQHSEAPISAATMPVVDPANPNPQPQPNHEGTVSITGEAKVGETLTATVNDDDGVPANVTYQWLANGVAIAGATGSSYQLTANDAGKTISVRATYTDNANHSETPTSAATTPVVDPANPNPQPPVPPTNHEGTVTITGEAKVGSELKAAVKDDDGFDSANVKYQWLRDGQKISGAEGDTYKLTADDVGHKISVQATYDDNAKNHESPTSAQTDAVVDSQTPPKPQPNHEGDVAISGNAKVGETLTAQVHDADQFDEAKVSYQWQRDGQPIANATGKTYTLTAEDEGHKISVKAEYTDNAGNKESHDAESGVVQPQSSTNQAPTDITLDNDKVAEGKDGAAIGKLTTTDPDAGDQHTYKVSDDRFEVTADGTLKLKAGKHLDYANEKTVTLQITTDDGHGGTYNKTFTLNVEDDPNYPPVNPPQPQPNHEGDVAISGNAKVGETLTAQVHDADQFDEAKVSYQWQRDGQPIANATGKTYTLTAEDEGHKISVKAEYTDNAGNKESHDAESGIVQPQSSTNQAPTDIQLSASEVAEGKDGATIGKLTTTDPDAGDQHTYKVSDDRFEVSADGTLKLKDGKHLDYANEKTVTLQITTDDGHGGSYNKTFTLNVQDDPNYPPGNPPQPQPNHEGDVAISGNAKVGETLTAQVHDADQFDEAKVSYQWQRDGQDIAGANGKTYTLTQDDAGHKISVHVEYTDNKGTTEKPTSAELDIGKDTPTPPNHEGTVNITGEGKVGSELTATITDADGVPDTGVTYQWQRDGQPIAQANGKTYTLTPDDAGHKISVQATYKDNAGHDESPTSAVTDIPAPQPNREGVVTIKGKAEAGSTLTADITDADGFAADKVQYQWLRDGQTIGNASGSTYTLGKDDIGHKISVRATYKDNAGHDESPLSEVTATVVADTTPPVLTITAGTTDLKQGETTQLTFTFSEPVRNFAANDIVTKGAGRLGNDFTQVDDRTYTVSYTAQKSGDITVNAGALSDFSGNQNQTSSIRIAVADAGEVSIEGEPKVGAQLTAVVSDDNGVPADVQYQWYADGVAIQNATAATYTLLASDKGKVITVRATYTDNEQYSEAPVSRGTAPIQEADAHIFKNIYELRAATGLKAGDKAVIVDFDSEYDDIALEFTVQDSLPDKTAGTANRLAQPLANGKYAILQTDDYTLPVENSAANVEAMLAVAKTYLDAGDALVWNADGGTPLYTNKPAPVGTVNGHNVYAITCSAFVNMVIGGWKYEDTTYNPANETSHSSYGWGVDFNDHAPGKENRPYGANRLLKWLYSKDQVALYNGDAANPNYKVGDILFFSQQNPEGRDLNDSIYFMNAYHTGIYYGKDAQGRDLILHSAGTYHGNGVVVEVMSEELKSNLSYIARPHLGNSTVTISGEAEVGNTLTATVADVDGLPDSGITYQWYADNRAISGATGNTYTLSDSDKGKVITVRAKFTDDSHYAEAPTSAGTAAVAEHTPPNQPGRIAISGEAKVGSELTATVTDADKFDAANVQFQWLRDGQPIDKANGSTYTLSKDDAGHKISVQATYKDNAGHDESPTSEATASVADNANAPLMHDDFSSYPLHKTYVDNDTFGAWKVAFAGYGNVEIIDNGGGNQALQLKPMARSGETETSSAMVLGTVQTGDEFTYSGTIATPEQLRQGATPNAWETAWLVWNHTDNDHYYYFVARADGWELGKRDPAYSGGQRFMATGSESWPLADAKDFVITKSGNTVEISINGKVITTFTDDENPYTGGSVGLYTEDARIVADDINLTATANITGTANHGGVASINGKAATGEVLHAAISDGDGAVSNVSYQWMAAGKEISGATGETYTVTADNSGKIISVRITYTDSTGKVESVISPPTAVVDSGNDSGANQRGQVTLSGTAAVGETLTANVSDGDGLPDRIQYTWLANGAAINGANGSSYTITAADVGKVISVQVYYYDKAGHEENLLSNATNAVTDTAPPPAENHAPTGSVTITGEAVVGKTLNASNDLADEDGLGNITYHWLADGKEIGTGASYTLTEAEKGKTITVKATYTDGKGTAEAVESRATNAVAEDTPPPANHEGTVAISGEAKIGNTLTAALDDKDGVDTAQAQYQWLRDGHPINGQTGNTYQLIQEDAGHKITVQATYKDNAGHDESPVSEAADIPALSANHQGSVTITGEALVGKTLTATIDDSDGVDAAQAHYQWLVDGKAVTGATNATYEVRPEDAGKAISVNVEYTDNAAHDEKLDSGAEDATVDHHRGYKLVWQDEFNGTTLNDGNWTIQTGGWNASKVQNYYSASDKNVSVSDGTLKLTAHYEPGFTSGAGKTYDFTSGFIQSQNKQAWTYGYIEARMKLPSDANGSLWPAFWMSPDKPVYGGHPRSGEIDILESRSHDKTFVAADAHWGTGSGKGEHSKSQGITHIGDTSEWHTYAVKWQEGKLEYYVDGQHYHTVDNFKAPNATTHPGPFNIPFYLRFNLAVGGTYLDAPHDDAHHNANKFPATMEVDYVRVYQQDGTPPTPPQTNHAPTGSVTISGKAQVGETLSAANTLADEDGLGNITYHWLADGKEIGTGETYTLTEAEKGKTLSVKASYTDGKGTPEELESDATAAIAEAPAPQTPPTVTISGAENINEGEAALYTVTLDKASDKPVTLTLTLSHGETTDGDLGNISKTLTIPAGETTAKVNLQTNADGIPENTEHYTLSISEAEGATVGADKAVTTAIADNDEKAAYHTGSVADTTFAGDRSANNHYFINSLDSTQRATYGHYSGHKAGEGLRITYAFSEDGMENGKVVDGHRPFSAQQKADIRTVLDHLEEHVNVKFTEGSNATLNFYLHNLGNGTSGHGVYGGNVHVNTHYYTADDAFAQKPLYTVDTATHNLTLKHGWGTVLHEIGHSLGMDHPFGHADSSLDINKTEDRNDLTVMSYTTGQYDYDVDLGEGWTSPKVPLSPTKLGIYDLAALHHAYGVNPNYHSGDDTYGFKPFNKDAVGNDIYIHDGDGQDTFDASEQTLDLNINLTPGSWIYAGSKAEHLVLDDSGNPTTNQMFIGYGTQIESAKGGTGNDTIKGNSAANYLFGFDGDDNIDGGAGNDQIEGGRGNDTLKGGAGGDTFIFRSPFDGTIDTLLDFNAAEGDRIQLDHNIFTGLQKGSLSAEQFVKGTEAKDADDRIIYNQATGELAYDADGNGSGAAVTIARLGINTELEKNHIQII